MVYAPSHTSPNDLSQPISEEQIPSINVPLLKTHLAKEVSKYGMKISPKDSKSITFALSLAIQNDLRNNLEKVSKWTDMRCLGKSSGKQFCELTNAPQLFIDSMNEEFSKKESLDRVNMKVYNLERELRNLEFEGHHTSLTGDEQKRKKDLQRELREAKKEMDSLNKKEKGIGGSQKREESEDSQRSDSGMEAMASGVDKGLNALGGDFVFHFKKKKKKKPVKKVVVSENMNRNKEGLDIGSSREEKDDKLELQMVDVWNWIQFDKGRSVPKDVRKLSEKYLRDIY